MRVLLAFIAPISPATLMKHHFVPAFYLRRWAAQDGKLIEFSRPRGREVFSRRTPPTATGYERDLYKFDNLTGEMVQLLETKFLAPNDYLASRALTKLISSGRLRLNSAEQSSFVRFLVGFRVRHPDPFKELRSHILNYASSPDPKTSAAYKEIRGPGHPATLEEWIAAQTPEVHDRIRVSLAQAAMDNERIGTRVLGMTWRVIDVRHADDLLMTSDWPLENNLGLTSGYIALPLSPHLFFIAAYQPSTIDQLARSSHRQLVHLMNRHTVRRARRYIWAANDRQRAFVEKHFGAEPVVPPFFPTLELERRAPSKIAP
jgi:hypothetical protein